VDLLQGKTAIITGGGTGIGLEIAKMFHGEGAYVVLCGRRSAVLGNAEKTIASNAGASGNERISTVQADVAVTTDVRHLVEETLEKRERIDVLVNCAGIMRFGRLEEASPDKWEEQMRVNPGSGIYCTTKAALQMMSQVLALEVAEDNIRVNLICPGAVEDTELGDAIFGKENVSSFYPKLASLHPLGRNGKPKDIASAALFLASEGSSWMTGAILPVDGGRHMVMNHM